ncbi:MAG: phosphate regulon sensor histidine kinase PhoR [Idiomarina sp.]|nr:phosphate regulon sensor histidine kinase PhoR [Idiomarina sp.]
MDRYYNLFRVLRRLVLGLIPVALLGWLTGYLFEALTIALFVVVLWNAFFQQRLNRWLWSSRIMHPPQAPGAWSDIYDGIYRTLRRSQMRQRNLALILQRFRQAAEAIPDAGLVIEADGRLVWSNKLAQLYFGLQWPTDRGIRITNLIRHPRFVKYFRKQNFSDAITLTSPTGDSREIELRIMPYAGTQLLVIARDVTRISRLERMRKDFVANVSHELKTPLTVMQGYLELMEEPDHMSPKHLQKAVRDISSQTSRMQVMVEQLLVLSRMESQGQETFTTKVNVPALIRELLTETEILAKAKDQKITADVAANLWIFGSAEKMQAAIHNLVTNAMKYTQAGGTIHIEWRVVGEQAEFAVNDNGPGIPAEHIPRLTERFYRVDEDRNRSTGGTGLGLSIVKHSLEHHRSVLQIESKPDQGSRFSFRLPKELTLIQ